MVPGSAADEKTGPIVPYRPKKPILIVTIYLYCSIFGGPECNYWIALMYFKISLTFYHAYYMHLIAKGTRQ